MIKKIGILSCIFFGTLSAQTSQEVITLDLTAPTHPSVFVFDKNKGNWSETYNDVDYSFFEVQSFRFAHLSGGPGASLGGYYWDGFTVCSSGDNTDYGSAGNSSGWPSNQWGCMAGGGIQRDEQGNVLKDSNGKVLVEKGVPYLVAFWPERRLSGKSGLITFTDGYTYALMGAYVAPHPWPYYGNLHGDGFARPLNQEGDFFKIIAHGIDAEGKEKTCEKWLAEVKEGKLIQSPDWQWMDLSSLGSVKTLYFTLQSSDNGTMGMNTASYFCMDRLTVQKSSATSLCPSVAVANKIYLSDNGEQLIVEADCTQAIRIFDAQGKLLATKMASSGQNSFDFSLFEKGLYLVILKNKTYKLLK